MPFDIRTAKPIKTGKFDISTAKPMDSEFGEIRKTKPFFERRVIPQTQRKVALGLKGMVGDIPFVRKLLPERIKKIEPISPMEKGIFGISRLGRDIQLLGGISELRTLRTALRGAGIGLVTAGSEDPVKILESSAKTAVLLPVLKGAVDKYATPFLMRITRKGIKTAQQVWQDVIRAGFMVEKSTVQRVQMKGMKNIFDKRLGYRNEDAFLRLGERIHNSAMKLRRAAGDVVGRWRNVLFQNRRIRASVKNARQTYQNELKKPTVKLVDEIGNARLPIEIGNDTVSNRILEINEFLKSADDFAPDTLYQIVDKIDDLIKRTRGTNEGRILTALRKNLKQSIYKAAPTNVRKGLKSAESKFGEVANATDDVFDKLKLQAEGVARKERIGATEQTLRRGLKQDTPLQERQIWQKLDDLLPQSEKFMELYKDIFAAQDLQREGIGWLLRRLFLAPRMAAAGLQAVQPLMRRTGKVLGTTAKITRKVAKPLLLRKAIESK